MSCAIITVKNLITRIILLQSVPFSYPVSSWENYVPSVQVV